MLNNENSVIDGCNNLKIEKNNNGGFRRAIFSECVDNLIFSYSRDFHYRDIKS